MDDTVHFHCPWCLEPIELWIDPETHGALVEDCEICCRPWQLHVDRDEDGHPVVSVSRAQ